MAFPPAPPWTLSSEKKARGLRHSPNQAGSVLSKALFRLQCPRMGANMLVSTKEIHDGRPLHRQKARRCSGDGRAHRSDTSAVGGDGPRPRCHRPGLRPPFERFRSGGQAAHQTASGMATFIATWNEEHPDQRIQHCRGAETNSACARYTTNEQALCGVCWSQRNTT